MAAVDVSDEPPPPAPKERSGLLEFLICGDEEVAVWDRIRPDAPSAASPARRIEELENTVKELSRLVKPHLRHKHSKKHPKKKEKEVEFEAVDDDEECKDSSSSYSEPHGTGGIVDILTHKHHEAAPARPGVDRASSVGEDDEGTTPGGSRRHSKRTSTVLREGFEAVTGVHIDAPDDDPGRTRRPCVRLFLLLHAVQARPPHAELLVAHVRGLDLHGPLAPGESASNYYTTNPMRDGSEYSENWYELTRKGHVWDIPFIIIGPLMFASLMIALSLRQEIHELVVGALLVMPKWEEFQLCETRLQRAGWLIGRGLAYGIHIMRLFVVFLYFQATMCVLGTSNGPFAIILDCLTLMFILELDNMIRFDSKHTLFGQAGLVSDKKVVLSKQLREIATAVLDSGTAWRSVLWP